MADIVLDEQSVPVTPSAGALNMYPDNTTSLPAYKNDGGRSGLMTVHQNASIANQAPAAATDTYLTDSDILIPSFGLQARSSMRWLISASKTAAGAVAPIWSVRIGSARTTADTARLTLTGPAQTAAVDVGVFEIMIVFRAVGASGQIQGTIYVVHNASVSGFTPAGNQGGVVEVASATFDTTAMAGQFIGISVNTGTSAVWTITQVRAEADW